MSTLLAVPGERSPTKRKAKKKTPTDLSAGEQLDGFQISYNVLTVAHIAGSSSKSKKKEKETKAATGSKRRAEG